VARPVRPPWKVARLLRLTRTCCYESLGIPRRRALLQLFPEGTERHTGPQMTLQRLAASPVPRELGVLPQGRRSKIPPSTQTEENATCQKCNVFVSIAFLLATESQTAGRRPSVGTTVKKATSPAIVHAIPLHAFPHPPPFATLLCACSTLPAPPHHLPCLSRTLPQWLPWLISTCPTVPTLMFATSSSLQRSET
jgi:hypothetical protein